jgi:hypothetical protein
MPTLLGNSGVINDPASRHSVPLHGVDNIVPGQPEHTGIIPIRFRNKMMHRLVPRTDVTRIDQSSHRLYALPIARQQQTGKVRLERLVPVSVGNGSRNLINIPLKPSLRGISFCGHASIISQHAGKGPHFMTQ